MKRRLVVIGGGIAGLAAAHAAEREAERCGVAIDVTLIEALPRLGGKVLTEDGGAAVEWGPDSFLVSKPGARELADELGLRDELVSPGASRAYLLLGGRLRRIPAGTMMGVPAGIGSLAGAVREGVLSPWGAMRALLEPMLPSDGPADVSALEVARRRLGGEVADRLVAPLLGGVYGAPAEELGLDAVPQLAGGRSLVLAARRARRTAAPEFRAIRGGMGRLVSALRDRLHGEVVTGAPVMGIGPEEGGFLVAAGGEGLRADAVVLAVPSGAAAVLLAGAAPDSARVLGSIEYRGSVIVHLRWAPGALRRRMDAAGYLVAPGEGGAVAACSWLNAKWPHLGLREPRARAVVVDPEAMRSPDEELAGRVAEEVGRVMLARDEPVEARVHRWGEALPVYAPGHRRRVAAARAGLPRGLALAGAAYDGIGLPDCIRSGQEASRALVRALAGD